MQDQKIDGGKPFDWGLTSADYAKYRDIYPDVLYQTLYEMGIGGAGRLCLCQYQGYAARARRWPAMALVLLGWIFRKNKSFRLGH